MEIDDYPQFGGQISLTIEEISQAHPEVTSDLRELDPVEMAATFGALLAVPELQANCLRIEALVHLALASCEGRIAPGIHVVRRCFESLGDGYVGMMEDPSEDVFVTLVNTPEGNFRIFEGIREGAGFHLQRVLNIVERMPEGAPYRRIRKSIQAMLVLSDEVAGRVGIRENILGGEVPLKMLPAGIEDQLSRGRDVVRFSDEDLERLAITWESLDEFIIDANRRSALLSQMIGHTELERRPIILGGKTANLVLPTAIATAITRYVVESVLSLGTGDTFERALSDEFAELFDQTPILGGPVGARLVFQRIPAGRISAVMTQADPGRALLLIFFVDGLAGFSEGGLSGANADPDALSWAVSEHLERASAELKGHAGFLDGICLLVGCGLGRSLIYTMRRGTPEHWRFAPISAYDLVTLSWVPKIDRLSLWRLLDSVDAIERQGAELLNANGLLNLVACSQEFDGHLVRHGELPDGFVRAGQQAAIQIPQNALRTLRHKVLTEWNPRRVLGPDDRWVHVRKISGSEFDEDRAAPLYGSEDDIQVRKLRCVYVTNNRPWWVGISAPDSAPAEGEFGHWEMLCAWLRRVAPVLEDAYRGLPSGPICFDVSFEEILGSIHDAVRPKNVEELRPLIHTSANASNSRISIRIGKGFDDGLIQPENIAERLLVEALVAGTAELAGEVGDMKKREDLVKRICTNERARHMHRFQARSFRDFVASEFEGDPVLADALDYAAVSVGLGWKVRSREMGAEISGVIQCTSFLNKVVAAVLDDLCGELRRLDRLSFVRQVLFDHEHAAHDRDIWSRSAQANIAMHVDERAAVATIVRHLSGLNACFTASRILLEAAICECPLEGGRSPGRLDLSRAMSKALTAHHLGGWSDAIYWGAMEPRLRVTPLGDVHMKASYIDNVYQPFGRAGGEVAVKEAVDSYARLYERDQPRSSFEEVFGPEFLDAWTAEFGASATGVRTFVDRVEDLGRQPPKVTLELPRSELTTMLASAAGVPLLDASRTVDLLTSKPRAKWREVGSDFTDKDWYPWRFRRRLSIARRPLIQVDTGDDPTILLAPGLLREAFASVVSWFYRGEIPPSQARSVQMRRWIGHANNTQRSEFNSIVARRMRELGWKADSEVRLTKILGRSLDRDYGDIDVLAWRPESGRVLAMECKDVQFLKTLGEVAEQLADFRGEVRPDGKPDHLKRHLDRLDVLAGYRESVARFLRLRLPIQVDGHLVFRNPVPMQFAWDDTAMRVRLSLFSDLDHL
jgi:hypothetical protein